ncbi:MAG TPA: DUF5591 domain-containing protein [Thermoplasmata archaeon]|nr:DUF5591 domain-containing protein [Thermoplasmata archaeon]
MPREVERLEGLSTPSRADLGPFRIATPGLLPVRGVEGVPFDSAGLGIEPGSPAGWAMLHRENVLTDGRSRFVLDFPIPAPEVGAPPTEAAKVGEGVVSIHWPLPDAGWENARAGRPDAVVLANAAALYDEGRPFVLAVGDIRRRLGSHPLLWIPRVALPHRLALLAYLGVDLVTNHEAVAWALRAFHLDAQLGPISAEASTFSDAVCPTCSSGGSSGRIRCAVDRMSQEIGFVRAAASHHRLRDLAEARQVAEPALAELLRYADRELADLLEERTPVTASAPVSYVFAESHRRPEVARFIDRLRRRYVPPASKKVLLVVPCSRTKPYRNSRTHRAIARAWEGLAAPHRIHVVSVTSPLGLVPRELEDVYPARHYDIPVTHTWAQEERERVVGLLRHLLDRGRYDRVVVHLDAQEYGFITDGIPTEFAAAWTSEGDRPTAPGSIDRLRRDLGADPALNSTERPGPISTVLEELREVAAFQFGRAFAESLFAPPVRLHGRPWFQRLSDGGGVDLATWREERGLFQLTVPGARRAGSAGALAVTVAPGFELRGDLFVGGVAEADPAIRVGDAVTLVRDNAPFAVGEAELPGRLMTELRRGRAVTVRHRAGGSATPGAPTAQVGSSR